MQNKYKTKLASVENQSAFIAGQRLSIQNQIEQEKVLVGEAKGRDIIQPLVLASLDRLQQQEHERPIDVFGKLLSALAKDVLPLAAKPIVLDLYTAHGSPALDIDVFASDKHKEEITSGALKNVLSVGLRLIAIARTDQRRFLVLDEPDHWIKPENVPQFVSVLDRIIRELGFQILMISHHPNEYFEKTAKCVHLEKSAEGEISVSGDLLPQSHAGLHALRLVNFESHKDTVIPLHEGMTVLTGENLLGKSSFVRGLKALINGETPNDRVIQHTPVEASSCRVEIKLENGQWVGWRRVRKLNTTMRHKNKFYIREDATLAEDEGAFLVAEDSSDGVPDFVRKVINIKNNGKLDVHVASQEESVFLINSNTKATDRAKILALGSEANVLHAMIEKNRQDSRKDKEIIREGEKRLGKWTTQMSSTAHQAESTNRKLKILSNEAVALDEKTSAVDGMLGSLSVLRSARHIAMTLKQSATISMRLQPPPTIHNTESLAVIIENLNWSKKWASVVISDMSFEAPFLFDVELLKGRKDTLVGLKRFVGMDASQKDIAMALDGIDIELIDTSLIVSKKQMLINGIEFLAASKQEELKIKKECEELEKELAELWLKTPKCPLCNQDYNIENLGAHSHT